MAEKDKFNKVQKTASIKKIKCAIVSENLEFRFFKIKKQMKNLFNIILKVKKRRYVSKIRSLKKKKLFKRSFTVKN